MPPIYRHRRRIKKKEKKRVWSAHKANLGARSLKPGTTRFFVGYKKHSLRLWLPEYSDAVLLIPLVSWAAPASVPEGFLLVPSIYRCRQKFGWVPEIVVGDLGYIEQNKKRHPVSYTHLRAHETPEHLVC